MIAVCVKWVDLRPEIDALTGAVSTDERRFGFSSADEAALELALRIVQARGGDVSEHMRRYLADIYSMDEDIGRVLKRVDELGLRDNTIIVFTADHGEMAGAHSLRGKGPFAYQETNHLPLYVVHPDVKGGQQCKALSSHIDFVPTLLSMAGVKADQAGQLAGRALPGKDLSKLLTNPGSQAVDAARQFPQHIIGFKTGHYNGVFSSTRPASAGFTSSAGTWSAASSLSAVVGVPGIAGPPRRCWSNHSCRFTANSGVNRWFMCGVNEYRVALPGISRPVR